MKLSNLVCATILGVSAVLCNYSVANAEYVSVYETDVKETFTVDTQSIYQLDPEHINCIVWYEWVDHKRNDVSGKRSMLYKFQLTDEGWMTWKPDDEANPEKSGKWESIKDKNVPKLVLRTCLFYAAK